MAHRLEPLLKPRSIAFVGASPRAGTVGNGMLLEIKRSGYKGRIFAVNPKYGEVEGYPCYPSIEALPEAPDLAVLAVANARLEAEFEKALGRGAKSAAIFASGYLENDRTPPLAERLRARAHAAAIPLCGGNCMGFYNYEDGVYVCGFPASPKVRKGGITFITHSGSIMAALVDSEERLGFNFVVSSGQELASTAGEYMDYALERPSTRLIALFLETVREPERFIAALEKARAREVPVVALKVGRTPLSAKLVESHSGALAGNDAAYQALFDRYGVMRVSTIDEMAAVCLLFSQERRVAPGGIASIHDSGGERANVIDLASDVGVPFASIGEATVARLKERLEYGLEPTNPLDAWGTGHDHEAVFTDCFSAMVNDPASALGLFFTDRHDGGALPRHYARICLKVRARTVKPIALVLHRPGSGGDPYDRELIEAGVPVIDGDRNALTAARLAFEYRDFLARPRCQAPAAPSAALIARWRGRLAAEPALDEAETLALLADFGVPVVAHALVESETAAADAARSLGFPAVLKTAKRGLLHKSEEGGVVLGLADEDALRAAYRNLAARLGPRVLVAPMIEGGVEMALGIVHDAEFGPLVMIAGGGILIELFHDARFALPPIDAAEAERLIGQLRASRLLGGLRGRPKADVAALAEAAARLSRLALELAGSLQELDVNPLIVTAQGCCAVDAALVPRLERTPFAER